MADDGASLVAVDDEDGIDGGVGDGDVAVVDGVDAAGALAGDGGGELRGGDGRGSGGGKTDRDRGWTGEHHYSPAPEAQSYPD